MRRDFIRRVQMAAVAAVVCVLALGSAGAQDAPATAPAAPADERRETPRRSGAPMIDRMRDAIGELELSDESRRRIDDVLEKTRQTGEEFRREIQNLTSEERRERFREMGEDLRQQIGEILSPEEQVELREKLGDAMQSAPPPGAFFERIREHLAQLRLDDEQREKIRGLFEQTRTELTGLGDALRAGDRAARDKAGEIMRDAREKLNEILTSDQQTQLRELMQSDAPPPGQPPRAPATTNPTGPGDKSAMMMSDDDAMMAGPDRKARARQNTESARTNDSRRAARGPQRGESAPDFTLKRLAGATVSLSSFEGRVVVLVFGSYTCPVFRNRADGIESLRKELGNRASVMIVYTREAHPTDGWEVERNKDDGINLRQTRDEAEREAAAKRTKDALKLTTPIVLDTMDDATADAFGGFPNGAVVIDREGNIAYRQEWFDPVTLRRHIDNAIKGVSTTQPSDL